MQKRKITKVTLELERESWEAVEINGAVSVSPCQFRSTPVFNRGEIILNSTGNTVFTSDNTRLMLLYPTMMLAYITGRLLLRLGFRCGRSFGISCIDGLFSSTSWLNIKLKLGSTLFYRLCMYSRADASVPQSIPKTLLKKSSCWTIGEV
ncbi:hypothetical protein GmHk_08G023462 [Glycine max]|nr:hypothetical protein GmHk_08G023462 [Glycine max]